VQRKWHDHRAQCLRQNEKMETCFIEILTQLEILWSTAGLGDEQYNVELK